MSQYNVYVNAYDDENYRELITKEPVDFRQACTIERGLDINLNHNDYYVSVEQVEGR
jgi:hypothetical protein